MLPFTLLEEVSFSIPDICV